jgi:hypothetical protein
VSCQVFLGRPLDASLARSTLEQPEASTRAPVSNQTRCAGCKSWSLAVSPGSCPTLKWVSDTAHNPKHAVNQAVPFQLSALEGQAYAESKDCMRPKYLVDAAPSSNSLVSGGAIMMMSMMTSTCMPNMYFTSSVFPLCQNHAGVLAQAWYLPGSARIQHLLQEHSTTDHTACRPQHR